MAQSKKRSRREVAYNIIAGYCINYILNLCIFPIVGLEFTTARLGALGVFHIGFSIARQYIIRRWFAKNDDNYPEIPDSSNRCKNCNCSPPTEDEAAIELVRNT